MVETNVGLPDNFKCYSLEQGLLKASEVVCGERGKLLSSQSLSFTAYSLNELFNGSTKQFYDFLLKD